MFCGAFTTRMKPKLTTNCSSMVMPTMLMPGVATPCSTAMMIGIIAEASAVALANPRWMTIRNSVMTPRMKSAVAFLQAELSDHDIGQPNGALGLQQGSSQADADAEEHDRAPGNLRLRLLPRHDAEAGQEHQSDRGDRGDEVSNLCRTPSVAQKPSSVSESASSFFSDAFMGPSSASDLRIASRPPGTCLHFGRHHARHDEIERDRHQHARTAPPP